MSPFRFTLRFVILSALASLLLLTWILLSLISFKTAEQNLIAQKNMQARQLLSAFFGVLGNGSDAEASLSAKRLAESLLAERGFTDIVILDNGGNVIFATGGGAIDERVRETLSNGKDSFLLTNSGNLIKYVPWTKRGDVIGAGRITISLTRDYQLLHRSREIFLTYFILDFLVLLVLGSYILSRLIVRPMRRLIDATERISSGDFQHRVHVPGAQEVAELAEAYNSMVDALKSKEETVQKHMQALQNANNELKQAREETIRSEKLASVGLLGAGMAHEIGTPLAAIIGYTGLLREELKDDPEKSDFIRRIEQDAEKINRLVQELLDYARPKVAVTEKVSLNELLQGVAELLTGQGVLKKVEVSIVVPPEIPPLYVDRHQLEQVFINLFINARDAMPSGGKISVAAAVSMSFSEKSMPQGKVFGRRHDDYATLPHAPVCESPGVPHVVIDVTDSGTGIPPQNLSRVFDPFFTTKEPGQGTGLGLAICSRIIDSFGGRIILASTLGEGTTFTLLIPLGMDNGRAC